MTQFNNKWFRNSDCEYFPCHVGIDYDCFSCKYCYCPLFSLDCGGEFIILESGIKSCMDCTFPHDKNNNDEIIKRLKMGYDCYKNRMDEKDEMQVDLKQELSADAETVPIKSTTNKF